MAEQVPLITFLDRATLGDISLAPLESSFRLQCHLLTQPEEVAMRLSDASVAITNKVVLNEELLRAASRTLKMIQVSATGTDTVDIAAAARLGITVCNVPRYSTESVAQLTLTFMLNAATSLSSWIPEKHLWPLSPFYTRYDHPLRELSGKTVGILGGGAIGERVASLARAFGMNVILWGRPGIRYDKQGEDRRPLKALLSCSDYITIHCPLTPETRHIINQESLGWMKRGSYLINTARGGHVDPAALKVALISRHLAGAALDVLAVEPPSPSDPLLDPSIPNLVITPHIGWTSREARTRMVGIIAENIACFLQGHPKNVVSG